MKRLKSVSERTSILKSNHNDKKKRIYKEERNGFRRYCNWRNGLAAKSYASIVGANERINVAVIGIRNQGSVHIDTWCNLKEDKNVVIKTLCDTDEQFFDSRSKIVQEKTGVKPLTNGIYEKYWMIRILMLFQ